MDWKEGLKAYVAMRAETVLRQKEESNKLPVIATEREIIAEIRKDVLESMRELFREGIYRGTTTLNEPALMRKR